MEKIQRERAQNALSAYAKKKLSSSEKKNEDVCENTSQDPDTTTENTESKKETERTQTYRGKYWNDNKMFRSETTCNRLIAGHITRRVTTSETISSAKKKTNDRDVATTQESKKIKTSEEIVGEREESIEKKPNITISTEENPTEWTEVKCEKTDSVEKEKEEKELERSTQELKILQISEDIAGEREETIEKTPNITVSTEESLTEWTEAKCEKEPIEHDNFVQIRANTVKLNETEMNIEKNRIISSETFCLRSSITLGFPNNLTCMLCCTTFDDPLELQAHLVILHHGPREQLKDQERYSCPVFDCLVCQEKKVNSKHSCIKPVQEHLYRFLDNQVTDGSPVTCLLCNGEAFMSVHHLVLHVVVFHGFRNNHLEAPLRNHLEAPLRCPLCYALFRTRNSVVLESHALNVHLPEMVITKQKRMHPEGQPPFLSIRHFACHFENARYNFLNKESGLQNCSSLNNDLSSLIGHLCYAHYPLPSDFKFSKARPISCNACQHRFKHLSDLRDHVNSSHNSFLKFRASMIKEKVQFVDHCDPRFTCHFCWSNQGSVIRLQTHILVYHVGSWRECGFCEREFCRANEYASPQMIYMTMERHVDYHMEQLKAHFEEMVEKFQYRKVPVPLKIVEAPDKESKFFKTITIRQKVTSDTTEAIFQKLRTLVEARSFHSRDSWFALK